MNTVYVLGELIRLTTCVKEKIVEKIGEEIMFSEKIWKYMKTMPIIINKEN